MTKKEIRKTLDKQMMAHLNAAFEAIDKELDTEYVAEHIGSCRAIADTAFFLFCIDAKQHLNLLNYFGSIQHELMHYAMFGH